MEWITGEDVITLTTLCGVNLSIVYRKCALILSVSHPQAVFLMDEWVMKDNIVLWSIQRLGDDATSEASDFVGITRDETINNKITRSKDCLGI